MHRLEQAGAGWIEEQFSYPNHHKLVSVETCKIFDGKTRKFNFTLQFWGKSLAGEKSHFYIFCTNIRYSNLIFLSIFTETESAEI